MNHTDPFASATPCHAHYPGSYDTAMWQIKFERDSQRCYHTAEELAEALAENPLPQFVSVVLYDRAYGGGEEGGWWYDTYQRVESHFIASPVVAARVVNRCATEFTNVGRRDVGSVLSDGRFYYQVSYKKPAPLREPEHRPHYE